MCTLGKGVKYQKILKVLFKEIIKNEVPIYLCVSNTKTV